MQADRAYSAGNA